MAAMEKSLMQRATVLLFIAAISVSSKGRGEDFTTATVAAASATPGCLEYCLVGVCVYLKCTLFGCSVVTQPQIQHTAPDLVVSSYKETGENPWVEARALLEGTAKASVAAQMGALIDLPIYGGGPNYPARDTSNRPDTGRKSRSVHFKETTVIGNPAAHVAREVLAHTGYVCPSGVLGMFPYFQSELDAMAWRLGVTETFYPETWLPGLREIGPWPLGTWGSVYPRHGFVTAVEPPKAAAVGAQRAVDIATRTGQPHVYVPAPVAASDEDTDRWQMISPTVDAMCRPFGGAEEYSPGRVSGDEDYGFLYWPLYECCKPPGGGAVLIGIVDTPDICLL
jgi:integrating conjugative element protein (TIGR03756 family)